MMMLLPILLLLFWLTFAGPLRRTSILVGNIFIHSRRRLHHIKGADRRKSIEGQPELRLSLLMLLLLFVCEPRSWRPIESRALAD